MATLGKDSNKINDQLSQSLKPAKVQSALMTTFLRKWIKSETLNSTSQTGAWLQKQKFHGSVTVDVKLSKKEYDSLDQPCSQALLLIQELLENQLAKMPGEFPASPLGLSLIAAAQAIQSIVEKKRSDLCLEERHLVETCVELAKKQLGAPSMINFFNMMTIPYDQLSTVISSLETVSTILKTPLEKETHHSLSGGK